MTKQEFLAASLPYGLKFKNKNEGSIEQLSGVDTYISANWAIPQYPNGTLCVFSSIDYTSEWSIDEATPIIRPLDSLVKECVQADYNDGKPFIPIVELTKLLYNDISWTGEFTLLENRVYFDSYESYNIFWYSIEHRCFMVTMNDEDVPVHNQLQLFQQLLKWHFWPNMPEGEEAVWVTETFNPYK